MSRHGVIVIDYVFSCSCNRIHRKNLVVIDYIELEFMRGNLICDVICCQLYSDKPVNLNLFWSTDHIFQEKYLMEHFAMLTP